MEPIKAQEGLASAGTFCPNEECQLYAKVNEGNIIKFGKSKQGLQRYRCKSCYANHFQRHAWNALLSQAHSSLKDILETLALLAEGVRISSLWRAKGASRRTRS